MTIDVFSLVVIPGAQVAIHNVLLVDVHQGGDGRDVLTIEHQGIKRELPGGLRWNDKFSTRDVGRVGYLEPVSMPCPVNGANLDAPSSAKGSYFRVYSDPSLRRVVELDRVEGDGKARAGWVCDARPAGFTAPLDLIPGPEGRFVSDETVEVILRVPPEFVRECRRVQRTPLEVLRGFVGDAAGIQNYVNNPRADGYSSNGSDERNMAGEWLDRAYGIDAIDIDKAEALDLEAAVCQDHRDDMAGLLDVYVANGGQADDLLKAVQELVTKQERAEAGQVEAK